ncbi:MAG: ClpXP protease specificity-enhancing factor SspB [Hyphomicrobiaceae bacterium]|nr:ClpXP protease specificity-enhancing factor SspB [Hyphomicrobiaceae bacterium]
MTAEPHIDYEALAQGAMRAVVRTVLSRVAKTGLPGEHHFYIAFNTRAPGVSLSPRLKERYPEEMTVVLQHRFWDLAVTDDRFEVNLTFDSIPERLVVPFTAIKVFFDPSVPYGLQFEDASLGASQGGVALPGEDEAEAGDGAELPRVKPRPPALVKPERKPRGPRKPAAEKTAKGGDNASEAEKGETAQGEEAPAAPPADPGPKVVKLDAFRKK